MRPAPSTVAGFEVRAAALEAYGRVLTEGKTVEEAMAAPLRVRGLCKRDGSFAAAIVLTVLRHKGLLEALVSTFLARPLPAKSGLAFRVMTLGAAQLLFMQVAPHAVTDLCVRLAQADRGARHFTGLINAVLRRVAREGKDRLATLDGPRLNTPGWLWNRWCSCYGEAATRQIAAEHANVPALDVSAKEDPLEVARQLNGECLVTGSVRLQPDIGPVEHLPGFAEGSWWVQDAAAALPARLFRNVRGRTVLDLCSAPGGKTMQLSAAGATVTTADISEYRVAMLRANLDRVGLSASVLVADVLSLPFGGQYDCVLIDAPCTATGTIRRHPELPYIRSGTDVGRMAAVQVRLLSAAAEYVRPGGTLIYCTCSLEPEEGEFLVRDWLQTHVSFSVDPVTPGESGIDAAMVSREGFLRTLPFMKIGTTQGLDGFFAARLSRTH